MNFVQQLVNGLVLGHAYALIAIGWTVLLGTARLVTLTLPAATIKVGLSWASAPPASARAAVAAIPDARALACRLPKLSSPLTATKANMRSSRGT